MAGYATTTNEERESGTGFEFTRRKKWPQILLQELVGTSLFCLKPYQVQRNSLDSSGRANPSLGWRIVYISPNAADSIGQKLTELENRDFIDLVYPADQPLLQTFFSGLLNPASGETSMSSSASSAGASGNAGTGRSQTTYARIQTTEGRGDSARSGPAGWEFRAHATGLDGLPSGFAGAGGYRLDGTVIPRSSMDEGGLKGKAVWVMGRRIGGGPIEETQSLDAFLELKLENEKLREELRELQHEIEDDDYQSTRSYMNPISLEPFTPLSRSPTPSSPSSSSSSSEVRLEKPKKKLPKTGKDAKDREREKKRPKKASMSSGPGGAGGAASGSGAAGGGASAKESGAEGLHVCVTCGRTDSPEWRKGPLGPKTLCNACGLRWAKRNSTTPSRKEKKAAEVANGKR